VKIDGEVVPRLAKPPDQCKITPNLGDSPAMLRDDDLIEVRIRRHDRRRRGLDDIREVSGRKALADRADRRCREDDIANLAEPNEKNS
jgi:hypothetical protein